MKLTRTHERAAVVRIPEVSATESYVKKITSTSYNISLTYPRLKPNDYSAYPLPPSSHYTTAIISQGMQIKDSSSTIITNQGTSRISPRLVEDFYVGYENYPLYLSPTKRYTWQILEYKIAQNI